MWKDKNLGFSEEQLTIGRTRSQPINADFTGIDSVTGKIRFSERRQVLVIPNG